MFILNRLLISSTYVVYSNVYIVLETQSVSAILSVFMLCLCIEINLDVTVICQRN